MADEKDITTAAEETAVQPAEVQEAANEAAEAEVTQAAEEIPAEVEVAEAAEEIPAEEEAAEAAEEVPAEEEAAEAAEETPAKTETAETAPVKTANTAKPKKTANSAFAGFFHAQIARLDTLYRCRISVAKSSKRPNIREYSNCCRLVHHQKSISIFREKDGLVPCAEDGNWQGKEMPLFCSTLVC